MKNQILILGLFLLLLLAGGVIVYLFKHAKETSDQYESVIQEKNDLITYHKNKEGELIAEKASAVISFGNAQISYLKELNRLKEEFGLKAKEVKQLKDFIQASFQVRDTGTTAIKIVYKSDSTKIKELNVTDGYLTLNADVTRDVVPWTYVYSDTLTAIGRIKKRGFLGLGHQDYFIDAKLQNRKAVITSLKSFRIEEFKNKRFSVGPAIGYFPFVPGPEINKIQIGIALSYSIIKF